MTTLSQQPTIPPCPACGGQRIGAPCSEGQIGRERGKSWSPAPVVDLKALVCTACGHTMLYVADLETLKKELLKHPEGFTY